MFPGYCWETVALHVGTGQGVLVCTMILYILWRTSIVSLHILAMSVLASVKDCKQT